MVSKSIETTRFERVRAGRIWWVGLLAVLAVTAVNSGLDLATVALFAVPTEFEPLQLWAVIFTSVMVVAGATGVYAIVSRFANRPVILFRRIAWTVLVISLLPLIPLYLIEPAYYPGTNLLTMGTLVVMHGLTAVISIGLLTKLAGES